MPDPPNATIAELFDELADLYELDGAVVHRVLAYRNAAKAVREAPRRWAAMTREGTVTQLPGIGKTLQDKLVALLDTGEIPSLDAPARRVPAGADRDDAPAPGWGPKRARKLYDDLGIDSLDALRAAAETSEAARRAWVRPEVRGEVLASVRGRRGREAQATDAAAARVGDRRGDHRAAARASRVPGASSWPGARAAWADSVKDLDIIATASDPGALLKAFAELDVIERSSVARRQRSPAGAHTPGWTSTCAWSSPTSSATCCSTSPAPRPHNVAIREAAVRRGLHVSEYGILDDETGETLRCEPRGGRLRAPRAPVDPARAARGPR